MTYSATVWLIDDDEMTNFYNQFLLQSNQFASQIRAFTNAKEALAELEAAAEAKTFPEYIFLDINMPVLDGWGFLQAYRTLPEESKKNCTLYILSSTIDEEDAKKAKIHEDVRDFISKPLDKINLEVIKFQAKDR